MYVIYFQIYWAGPMAGSALAAFIYGVVLDLVDKPDEDDDGGYSFPGNYLSLYIKVL